MILTLYMAPKKGDVLILHTQCEKGDNHVAALASRYAARGIDTEILELPDGIRAPVRLTRDEFDNDWKNWNGNNN